MDSVLDGQLGLLGACHGNEALSGNCPVERQELPRKEGEMGLLTEQCPHQYLGPLHNISGGSQAFTAVVPLVYSAISSALAVSGVNWKAASPFNVA